MRYTSANATIGTNVYAAVAELEQPLLPRPRATRNIEGWTLRELLPCNLGLCSEREAALMRARLNRRNLIRAGDAMNEAPPSFNEILSGLKSIATHAQLKLIGREVGRRARQLDAEKAATFEPQTTVSYNSSGKWIQGIVQRVDGSNVLVKLAHGFIARVAPDRLRR